MMRLYLGGTASKPFRQQFCRANVLFVSNLTQDTIGVQFSSATDSEITHGPSLPAGRDGKVNSQNTQFTRCFNRLFALTPLRSVAIISVSVRSAELRLGLYV
jgi:hypothetical protein